MTKHLIAICLWLLALSMSAADTFVSFSKTDAAMCLSSQKGSIQYDNNDYKGVLIAIDNLKADLQKVIGRSDVPITIGTFGKSKLIDKSFAADLKGKTEKYVIRVNADGIIIAGSDKRGTIYGIYELSRQIGVSPWYWWADVPVIRQNEVYAKLGSYTDGEPAVRYRGLFLNDEAPCLTTWVKNTFGTDFGGHDFYAHVFELILRLKGNYMWPAMWGWSFYADDPLNSQTADEMGIVMGTSHHEPMARNHQEWARNRKTYGEWDYTTNQKVIDNFFREGMKRAKDTEDLITIGMRGDGDTAMGAKEGHDDEFVPDDAATIRLLEGIIANQRKIIKEETGKPANKRQQVWALYKEVQRYYDLGLKVPDDVIILFSDDNWGDVRRLPSATELKHKGGFGMYYHVDYVGAPRNSKWLNVTPIQHMWDQLSLTYQYGVDKLWVLNVGDLKPMEYPITLFMDMAWDPTRYNAANLLDHPRQFCAEQLGAAQADEAARILNLYSQYAGRVTAEMLDAQTYNVETGEWRQVADEFIRLEADALRLLAVLPEQYHDAYRQLILFPVQALGNVYQMYYAQAMNQKLYREGNPEANLWADRVEAAFKRDAELCLSYNKDIAGGKWDGMMIQKHIGYRNWNDNFPTDVCPRVSRFDNPESMKGGYTFEPSNGYIAMDAEHYYSLANPAGAEWTVIPYMGRTRSGISVQPYNASTDGASITYSMNIPEGTDKVDVYVICASTLAFKRSEGHRYTVGFEGQDAVEVNYNGELNEAPENVYRVTYPTVARRLIEKKTSLKPGKSGVCNLTIKPLDPGLVLQKIVVDLGGYRKSYLYGDESKCTRK
ncbi:MAG: glycosyl hydrolase 115 family protein [Bacteroidaceae bacterium]|nr:glycosyl hydrolase 115 family protein [Bacteroidaceae bacterium]